MTESYCYEDDDDTIIDSSFKPTERILDPIPPCRCGGEVIFIGHENPDGKWIKNYKWWFKCIGCNRTWYEVHDRPMKRIFSI